MQTLYTTHPSRPYFPLLEIRQLTTLRIDGGCLSLDADGIKLIARSLTKLTSLHLLPRCPQHADITLSALFYLAEYCPDLETIGLCVDAREELLVGLPGDWHSQSRVRSLWLVDSPIGSTPSAHAAVFQYCTSIFPAVCYIDHRDNIVRAGSQWTRDWKQVAERVMDRIIDLGDEEAMLGQQDAWQLPSYNLGM